jgi:hypothetical protein
MPFFGASVRGFDVSAAAATTTTAVWRFDLVSAAYSATAAAATLERLGLLGMLALKRLHLLRVLTLQLLLLSKMLALRLLLIGDLLARERLRLLLMPAQEFR